MNRVKYTLLAAIPIAMVSTFVACSTDDVKEWLDDPSSSSLETPTSSSSVGNTLSSSGTATSSSGTVTSGTFTDSRDGVNTTYRWVQIGTQTWMAENLKYYAAGSLCYDDYNGNCDEYGRLYDWVTAMNLPDECNEKNCQSQIQTKHQGICPNGWHIPSDNEWTALVTYAGTNAATKLKNATGWNLENGYWDDNLSEWVSSSVAGTNNYGFSAKPSGVARFYSYWDYDCFYDDDGEYQCVDLDELIISIYYTDIEYAGYWWSDRQYDFYNAFNRVISPSQNVDNSDMSKDDYLSVRCIKNET